MFEQQTLQTKTLTMGDLQQLIKRLNYLKETQNAI